MIVFPKPNNRKIMNLEQFAKMRGLYEAYTSANSQLLDHFLASEQGDEIRKNVLSKRLQFDTTPELFAEVERVCALLHCSKREFLEMVVCDGLDRAEELFLDAFKEGSGRDFFDVHGVKQDKEEAK